jgi:TfoX/Sxy family transcriptional regulator of competence genes
MFGGYGLYVEAMDSPRLMEPWARLALEAALRTRAKPGRRR